MRSVPHPVAIITATEPLLSTSQNLIQRSRGATVSSFNTVCLDPIPVVSFNITRLSSTFHALEHSNQFVVHLLASNSAAVDLASRFSRGNATNPFIGLFARHEEQPEKYDLQTGAEDSDECVTHPSPSAPLLHLHNHQRHHEQASTIHFSLSCKYLRDKTVVVGDHVVVLGTVDHVWDPATEGKPTGGRDANSARTAQQQQCLSYVNGGYWGV